MVHLTKGEYSQAQVRSTVAYALSYASFPFSIHSCQIHFASIAALTPGLLDFETALSPLDPNGPLHFHTLPGPDMSTTLFAPSNIPLTTIPPGTRGTTTSWRRIVSYTRWVLLRVDLSGWCWWREPWT